LEPQLRNLGESISFILVKQRSVVLIILEQIYRKGSAQFRQTHLRRKSGKAYLVLPPQWPV